MIYRLEVTAPAVSHRLCTVQQARDHVVGIDAADVAATAALEAIIDGASARIAHEIGYAPGKQSYNLTVYDPPRRIVIPHPIGVEVLALADAFGETLTWTEVGPGIVAPGEDVFEVPHRQWPAVVEVEFTAGFTVTPAAVNAPGDLRHAAVVLVAQQWLARGRSPDVASQDLDGVASVNYEPQRLPLDVLDVIDSYRMRSV